MSHKKMPVLVGIVSVVAVLALLAASENWGFELKRLASDGAEDDNFGTHLAISGNIVAVSAPGVDDNGSYGGAVYIFQAVGGDLGSWTEVKKLISSDGDADDGFGPLSISGDVVIVGAYKDESTGSYSGSAYIFQRNWGGPDNWGEVKKLKPSDPAVSLYFGWSVVISGDIAIVGGIAYGSTGAAYVFQRNHGGADNWGEVAKLTASDGLTPDFGYSVDLEGDIAVVGARFAGSAGSGGSAYVFRRTSVGGDQWKELKILKAPDAGWDDYFGTRVILSAETLVVGAPGWDDGASWEVGALGWNEGISWEIGAVYVFEKNQGGDDNWGYVTRLKGIQQAGDFGHDLGFSGNTLVGKGNNPGFYDRVVKYQRIGGSWGYPRSYTNPDGNSRRSFGTTAVEGPVLVTGAYGDDNENGDSAGAVWFMVEDALFLADFEDASFGTWSAIVRNPADNFNYFLAERGMSGAYTQCIYATISGTYTYLGQSFHESNGGVGGAPIQSWIDLYWKNEELASTVAPYASEDADGDGTINSADADAFDSLVQ